MLARSYLFAPGHDEKLLGKVFAAGADAVVLDLEDAVPAAEKAAARARVAQAVRARAGAPGPPVFVRVNAGGARAWGEDVRAAVGPGLAGVRLPKAESVDEVRELDEALAAAERRSGMPERTVQLACTIESARGVLAAPALAASPRVRNLVFGAADFAADVGADPDPDETETLLARSALVIASCAAGIDPPVASVHTALDDVEALRRTSESARRLGYLGRSCIHPRQLAIVHEVFTPPAAEVARARALVAAYREATAAGRGALAAGGQFVDLAVVRRAQAVLDLAASLRREEAPGR